MLVTRARDNASYLAFCNLVGGQDELVFDGHSVVLDDEGEVIARAPGFEEALLVVDLDPTEALGRRLRDVRRRELERSRDDGAGGDRDRASAGARARARPWRPASTPFEPELEQMRLALGLGLRDYVEKSGFREVVVARLGRDRLGPHGGDLRRRARRRARAQRLDALALLVRGNARRRTRGERATSASTSARSRSRTSSARSPTRSAPSFAGREPDLTEENLQARARGTLLMALSNKFGWLVVSTGNKSEMAVGYATLYGDMVGGFALLKDVFKTDVFRLSRHLNERAGRELIPVSTIERPPSAELRAEQRDDQSLPPYELLDPVLEAYVELDRSREELLAEFDAATVERVLALVDRAEYKRRQAPPGVKLRPRAFGRDWRLPIAKRWQG